MAETAPGNVKSIDQALAELQTVSTSADIETALEAVSVFSPGAQATREAFLQQVQHLLDNEDAPGSKYSINAKLRRKIKRLQESLLSAPVVEAAPLQQKNNSTNNGNNGNYGNNRGSNEQFGDNNNRKRTREESTPGTATAAETERETVPEIALERDLGPTVAAVRASTTAAELETALDGVRPGVGTCNSRRTLKRAIDQAMARPEIEAGLNAKSRRRVARALKALVPGATEGLDPSQLVHVSQRTQKQQQAIEEENERKRAKPAKAIVPYVVFVGQLDFDSSAEDVERFFASKGIEGRIKVRLLTHSDTGRSKGMAFLEVDNAVEMHKCIALHRVVYKGRMLNIEKSCGGSNKSSRQEKLTAKRSEQTSKMRELVTRVLDEYAEKNIVHPEKFGAEFKERVYTAGPHIMSKVMQTYANLPGDKRSLAKIDSLIEKFRSEFST